MLVVNPNNRNPSPFSAVEPPLWAGLCASYLAADILDAEAEDLTLDQTVERIDQWNDSQVLIVVMGNNPSVSSTPKMPVAEALAGRLRNKHWVALTGLHPLAAGSRFPVVKIEFPMRTRSIRMPWNRLPMTKYQAHNWHCLDGSPRSPYASIYTSLGCPFNCYYCNIHALYGGKRQIKFRRLADIAKELSTLTKTYHVRNIKIWDELFAFNEARTLEVCDILKSFPDLNIWAYARLDTVTEKMLRAMKEGGINWLAYGFESVKDKKFIRRADDVIRMTREAGISIIANFMFGLPETPMEDDMASLEFAKRHLFEYVNFYDAQPYPGSKWYEDEKAKDPPGVVDYWDMFDQYKHIGLFRQYAFKSYFANPAYLDMIQKKWGNQAVTHIKEVVAWKFPVAVR